MADPRFFSLAGPFTLSRLAELSGAELGHGDDGGRQFVDVAPLDTAGPNDVSFVDNRKYAATFASSKAGACVIHSDLAGRAPGGMALLLAKDPYRTFACIAQAFHPVKAPEPWVAPTAWVILKVP